MLGRGFIFLLLASAVDRAYPTSVTTGGGIRIPSVIGYDLISVNDSPPSDVNVRFTGVELRGGYLLYKENDATMPFSEARTNSSYFEVCRADVVRTPDPDAEYIEMPKETTYKCSKEQSLTNSESTFFLNPNKKLEAVNHILGLMLGGLLTPDDAETALTNAGSGNFSKDIDILLSGKDYVPLRDLGVFNVDLISQSKDQPSIHLKYKAILTKPEHPGIHERKLNKDEFQKLVGEIRKKYSTYCAPAGGTTKHKAVIKTWCDIAKKRLG